MTIENMTLEECRIFSQFNEGMMHIDTNDGLYICIGGIAMPYRIGLIFSLWIMTGYAYYAKDISHEDVNLLKLANKHLNLSSTHGDIDNITYTKNLYQTIQQIMRQWDADMFMQILPSENG